MSLNKYMHPRNIYKTPPNFKQLAVDYPEFRRHIIQDVSGKVSINFKDPEALRALSRILLKKDFDLDVEMPLSRMIPTIPLRLNYILWIEDLLSIAGEATDVQGIDIGTGASCIYPLLAAKKGWSMVATEVDQDSAAVAQQNVKRNTLQNLITVKHVNENMPLKEAVGDAADQSFDFCMCNPPFFGSMQELNPTNKARKPDRPRPRNAFCATTKEVVAEGGEVDFIKKIICDSKELDKRIRIYTSMVGHKSNLPALKKLLRDADVMSFKQTEFCQGHTTRWALAWTFHDIDLRAVPAATVAVARRAKPKPPLSHTLQTELSLGDVATKLVQIFDELLIENNLVKENKGAVCYCITASSNTWAHQRRKRREKERLQVILSDNNNESDTKDNLASPNANSSIGDTLEQMAQMSVHSLSPKSPSKRELDDDGFYNCKRRKVDTGDEASEECYLKCSAVVRKIEGSKVIVELLYLEGSAGREGAHQVLQYIKNNFKL